MTILAFFVPISEAAPASANFLTGGQLLVLCNNRTGSAFEMQPGKITGPATDEWLRESQEHDQQAGVDGIEARLDPRTHHIRERDTQRATQHQIRDNPQRRDKYTQAEEKDGK